MNIKKLAKQIDKYYHSHGQHLLLETWEMIQNNEQDCSFDVHLADSNIYLFAIQNYNVFQYLDGVHKSYFNKNKYRCITVWDGVSASYAPLYIDQTFTLKTFKSITKEDMIHATDYFCHEILGMWNIWNIAFKEDSNGEAR